MKFTSLIKEIKPVYRNKKWLGAKISLRHKVGYYFSVLASYAKLIGGRKSIQFLGATFEYDNFAAPLNLMPYPEEVHRMVVSQLKNKPKTILDIGGNLGQFSTTLSYFSKQVKIDSFEPNPVIFELLKRNLARANKNAKAFNYALSPDTSTKRLAFYYEPGRSATGSFVKANATDSSKPLKKIDVAVVDNPSKITGRTAYDLIKVDVEGYEIDVIKSLRGIKTKYLFIEISSNSRSRNYSDQELFSAIKDTFGDFVFEYATGYDGRSPFYEVLIRFL